MCSEVSGGSIGYMPKLAENRKGLFDYEILEKYEGGLMLHGHEVKSIRNGGLKLKGAYVTLRGGEVWLLGAHIQRYTKAGSLDDYDPDRIRKVLLHKRELKSLTGKLEQKGLTLVPISVYTKGSKIKIEFGIGRGKKKYEKKEQIKKRDIEREIRRSLKG